MRVVSRLAAYDVYMSDKGRTYLLESIINRGWAEDFLIVRIPMNPGALAIKEARLQIESLKGLPVAGNILVSGQTMASGTYVDDREQIRLFTHHHPVRALIPLDVPAEGTRILVDGQIQEMVMELESPHEAVIRATCAITVLATELVEVAEDDLPCRLSRATRLPRKNPGAPLRST